MIKLFLLLSLCCLALPNAGWAETLDEGSIRKLYAESDAALQDTEKTRHIMQSRLDEKYVGTIHQKFIMANYPPKEVPISYDKTTAIDNVISVSGVVTIAEHTNKIDNIKFSDDKKFAYVADMMSAAGTMLVPVAGGRMANVHYTNGQGCLDMLSLIEAKIKILKSECNSQLTLQK